MKESEPKLAAFSWRWLAGGLLAGAVLQVILLAFSLHASLLLASLSSNCANFYWALCGAYMTLGFSIALVLAPWHRFGVRVLAATIVLLVPFLGGFLYHLQ
jgi:hypothetical protein